MREDFDIGRIRLLGVYVSSLSLSLPASLPANLPSARAQGNRRHNSPSTSRDRPTQEEEEEEDTEYLEAGGAERSDRGPVIGAHLGSLKDKRREVRLAGVKRGTGEGWSASVEGEFGGCFLGAQES